MEELLLEYFKQLRLKVLDNSPRSYYTGVTIPYIFKYVLKEKYSILEIVDKLLELHQQDKIHCLYCGDVKDVVFENIESIHWNYRTDDSSNYENHSTLLEKLTKYRINE